MSGDGQGAVVVGMGGGFGAFRRARFLFFLMIRRPPRSTQSSSSAASDVYKGQSIFLPIV